jgi:D-ribose pyranose/furanose isomerase RbsD
VTTSQAAAAAAEEALASRVAEIEAAAAAQVDAEVINRLAAAGTDPIARDPDADRETQTMKHSEFKKLKANQANAFIRAGGKLSD